MTYLYIFLALIAVIIIVYGICYIVYRIMQPRYADSYTWHIKKGHHFCSLWQRIVFCMFWIGGWKFTARMMEYTVRFNETMKYDHKNANQYDWNKLPGFQKGFDKTNRYLRGWRYSKIDNDFDVSAYFHDNSIKPEYTYFGATTNGSWKFKVQNPYSFATPLFVYFGGDEVAPHDMDITITGMALK